MKLRSLSNVLGFLPSGKPFKRQPVEARRPPLETLVARRERMLRLPPKDLVEFRMWVEDRRGRFLAPQTAFAERLVKNGMVTIRLYAEEITSFWALSLERVGVIDDEGFLISEQEDPAFVINGQKLAVRYELTGRV